MYSVGTGTLQKEDQKNLARYEMRCWRRTEKITWTDRVRNEVLRRVKEERNVIHMMKEGRMTRTFTYCVGTTF